MRPSECVVVEHTSRISFPQCKTIFLRCEIWQNLVDHWCSPSMKFCSISRQVWLWGKNGRKWELWEKLRTIVPIRNLTCILNISHCSNSLGWVLKLKKSFVHHFSNETLVTIRISYAELCTYPPALIKSTQNKGRDADMLWSWNW